MNVMNLNMCDLLDKKMIIIDDRLPVTQLHWNQPLEADELGVVAMKIAVDREKDLWDQKASSFRESPSEMVRFICFLFFLSKVDVGVSENSVPLNPMVLLIIIPIKWLFVWEYTLFSDKPMYILKRRTFGHRPGCGMTSHWLYILSGWWLVQAIPLPASGGVLPLGHFTGGRHSLWRPE